MIVKKVSVIVPAYNAGKYLKQCLDSLVIQTLSDIEIIIINDGSTDNSLNIIHTYLNKHPKLMILVNSQNQGVGQARNFGIDIASGEYICFLDSDDWLYEDSIEKMYTLAKEHNTQVVMCDLQRRFGNIKKPSKNNNPSALIDFDKQPDYLFKVNPGLGNKMISRKLIGNLRMPNLKWEDLPFSLVLVADGERVYHLAERNYNYRMTLSNTTTKDMFISSPRIVEIFEVLTLLEQNFKDCDIYDKYALQLKRIYFTNVLRRVADVASWFRLSIEDKRIIVNSLINIIELKHNDFKIEEIDNYIASFNPLSKYMLKNRCYELFDRGLRQNSDEDQIKKAIVKTLK